MPMTKKLGRLAQWAGLLTVAAGVALVSFPAGLVVLGIGTAGYGALLEAGDR